jgi:zinc protease
MQGSLKFSASMLLFILVYAGAVSAYDLKQTRVEKLQNGLTVMILEDHAQRVVSSQMLYKVGARNECEGFTGLAHFLEHMAFRATKNFPNTDVVSRIYNAGGEWHGYTWIDQTTYFETVPVEYFDMVLLIQADRMNSASIRADEVQAERGAVMTELRSYENDPSSLLNDAVMAVSFLQHPYRNNTIGWVSDVERLTYDDIVNFYHRFYNPSNAVLAISGDVNTDEALALVHKYFDTIPAGNADTLPRTIEPPQIGERRVALEGSGSVNYFQITYRAPSARDSDYAPFLILQALLSGSGGVNFRQRGSGEPAAQGSLLYKVAPGIATFFIPTADPYILNITGRSDSGAPKENVETAVEQKITQIRGNHFTEEQIAKAKTEVQHELIFDLETTEDVAHQMAYFEGIGAFAVLQQLPDLIAKVTPEDVNRVARKYLQPDQRTIGWYVADNKSETKTSEALPRGAAKTAPASPESFLSFEPHVKKLKNGMTVIVQRITRTPTGYLRILIPTDTVNVDAKYSQDDPVWGYTSVEWKFLKEDLAQTIQNGRKLWDSKFETSKVDPIDMEDPEFRLNFELDQIVHTQPHSGDTMPRLIVVAGDLEENQVMDLIEKSFGSLEAGKPPSKMKVTIKEPEKTIRIPGKAQSQFGYAVAAPSPSDSNSYAYRILLYIMTHGYEGRLGHELINRRGLVYYIGSSYNSDGSASWVSMTMGVNPDNLKAARSVFDEVMNDLKKNPPDDAEVNAAKQHLIGRRISAYQSNEELTGFYAREWLEQGKLISQTEFEKIVRAITPDQVRKVIPGFLHGARVTIDTSPSQ